MWQRVVNSFIFLLINKRIVVYGLLRRFTPRNDNTPTPSLRGFEKAVAISFILGLSLREPKVRGNLSMGHNYPSI